MTLSISLPILIVFSLIFGLIIEWIILYIIETKVMKEIITGIKHIDSNFDNLIFTSSKYKLSQKLSYKDIEINRYMNDKIYFNIGGKIFVPQFLLTSKVRKKHYKKIYENFVRKYEDKFEDNINYIPKQNGET